MNTRSLLLCALLSIAIAAPAFSQKQTAAFQPSGNEYIFLENSGQLHDQNQAPRPDVRYYGTIAGMGFYLRNGGVSYQLTQSAPHKTRPKAEKGHITPSSDTVIVNRVDINWLNSSAESVSAEGRAKSATNFYTPGCGTGIVGVGSYSSVTYTNIYPGININWYYSKGELKYDYLVEPGADWKLIRLEILGADHIEVNRAGDLVIHTASGSITEKAPVVLQAGRRLHAKWILKGNIASFSIRGVDASLPFVIDPVVRAFASYFGGGNWDILEDIQTDSNGIFYIAGSTISINQIATSGSFRDTLFSLDGDAFIAKFDSTQNKLWATYFGGDYTEYYSRVLVAGNGEIVLIGSSASIFGISTPGAYQLYNNDGLDCFLAKFTSSGTLLWATYFGGESNDIVLDANIDVNNNILFCGYTFSMTGITGTGAHQPTFNNGNLCGFLAKFSPTGYRMWSTYYCGEGTFDEASSCFSDQGGNVYLSGTTTSSQNIATPGSFQDTIAGVNSGAADQYLIKFSPTGTRLWGTYFGGIGDESLLGACINNQYIYMSGYTNSTSGIAHAALHQQLISGLSDGYLAKFDLNGNRIWATYIGGSNSETELYCAPGMNGSVHLYGKSRSVDGIATPGSYQTSFIGGFSQYFINKFDSTGVREWGSYFGGDSMNIEITSISSTATNELFIGGNCLIQPSNFTTSGSYQPIFGGQTDGFFAKFIECPLVTLNIASQQTPACFGDSTGAISLSASGGNSFTYFWPHSGDTTSSVSGLGAGSYSCISTNQCGVSDTITVTVTAPAQIGSAQTVTICNGDSVVVGSSVYSSSGIYTDIFPASNGCDSVVTTNLIVNAPAITFNLPQTIICTDDAPLSLTASPAGGVFSGPGVSGNMFNPQQLNGSQTLYYTYTDSSGCTNQSAVVITVNPCTGILPVTAQTDISINPNPSSGAYLVSGLQTGARISVYNSLGEIIYSQTSNQSVLLLNLAMQAEGVYLLRIDTENSTSQHKLIKTK